MRPLTIDALIALQSFVVAFIALHDWAPLGALNDVSAVQAADPRRKLIVVTALSTAPFAFGLGATITYAGARFPGWLTWYLWISYGLAVYGLWRAWWGPYFLGGAAARAIRYQAMFGRTHAFLPERNGIRPNTLHVTLHVVMIAIVVLLGFLSFSMPQVTPA
jgi:hypothetical protein